MELFEGKNGTVTLVGMGSKEGDLSPRVFRGFRRMDEDIHSRAAQGKGNGIPAQGVEGGGAGPAAHYLPHSERSPECT